MKNVAKELFPALKSGVDYVPLFLGMLSLCAYGFYELGYAKRVMEMIASMMSLAGIGSGLIMSYRSSRRFLVLVGTVVCVVASICSWLLTSV